MTIDWHQKHIRPHKTIAAVTSRNYGRQLASTGIGKFYRWTMAVNWCLCVSPFESNVATGLQRRFRSLLYYCRHMHTTMSRYHPQQNMTESHIVLIDRARSSRLIFQVQRLM